MPRDPVHLDKHPRANICPVSSPLRESSCSRMLGMAEECQGHGKVEGRSLMGEKFLFKKTGGIKGTSKATDVRSKGLHSFMVSLCI